MATNPGETQSRRWYFIAVGVATALALWLRVHGITIQVVIDDEWHALHKLQDASYSAIFNSFGLADHSIPLTLLYKWMANNFGLAEGRLRALQVITGVALVPVCSWMAWGATRDRAAAALFAFLVAGAPVLVMWSRFARPYSISVLLTVLCVGAIWRWRAERSRRMALHAALWAALAAWFHPLAGMYPAIACLLIFAEDLRQVGKRPGAWRQSLLFGAAVAGAMLVLLVSPLIKDHESLSNKSGGDHPNFDTYEWMFAIIWGGLPTPVYVIALAIAAWGLVLVFRRDRALGMLLALLSVVPAIFLTITGAVWIFAGGAFLRYQLPLLLLVLFFGSVGAVGIARALFRRRPESAAWIAAAACSAGYLLGTPAIAQVAKLGIWYAHMDHHWDYRYRWIDYKRPDPSQDPPDFYRQLGAMPPGKAGIVEAPYVWEAPLNPLAYYSTYYHQPEWFGMLYDLCKSGDRLGEVPKDRRFRFRRFVFLDNPSAVRATGARYLIYMPNVPTRFSPQDPARCIARLTQLYGEPMKRDERTVVWDLKR